MKVIGLVAGMALAGGAVFALAQENPADEPGRRGRGDAQSFIERYDADKDGKVDAQELEAGRAKRHEEMKARMLERFDANKNGVLDPEERQAARTRFRGRRGHRGPDGRMLERFDANKNGVLDPEEKDAARAAFAERRAEFVKRFDTNGDGRLDETERAAARKEFPGRGHRDHRNDQK
jgi:Ca2+-binding EF-hand superfamily protein